MIEHKKPLDDAHRIVIVFVSQPNGTQECYSNVFTFRYLLFAGEMMSRLFFATLVLVIFGIIAMITTTELVADDSVFSLNKRRVRVDANENLVRDFEAATWQPEQTAVIVCDV